MPVSSAISCCQQLRPPGPPPAKEEAAARVPLSRRRACFVAAAAAACVVAVAAGGAGEAAAAPRGAPQQEHEAAALVRVQAPGAAARWSERRQCPPWRANSLENVVPENLPRPSARRRYNGVAAADPASPEAVLPFLALRSGGMGCFSL